MKFAFKFLCVAGGLIALAEAIKRQCAPPTREEAAAALEQFAVDKKYTGTIELLCELSAVPIDDTLLMRVGDEMRYIIWRNVPLPDDLVEQHVRQLIAELRGEKVDEGARPAWDYLPAPDW
jgi:hypothetical protein